MIAKRSPGAVDIGLHGSHKSRVQKLYVIILNWKAITIVTLITIAFDREKKTILNEVQFNVT